MSIALSRLSLFATRRSRTVAYGVTVAAAAVAAVLVSEAEPTRSSTADAFWNAALVAVVASFGATARRWTWFLPAGTAAVIAGDGVALGIAALAIVIAFVSVLRDTRSRARGALVTGLGTLALLRAGPLGFHGSTALLTAAAALPAVVSGYQHAGRRVRVRARRVAAVACGVIGLMVVGAALGAFSVADELSDGISALDGGLEAARDTDDDLAAEEFDQAARALSSADATLSSWLVSPAKTLPFIGPNLNAVSSLSSQVGEVAEVTSLAANSADVDALRFVGGRIDPEIVADMKGPLDRVLNALDNTRTEVERARSPWLAGLVSSRIDLLDDQMEAAFPDAEAAARAVGIAPMILGADAPQRYLVLFTTPVEARGRFGFPGNYAELVFDDGRLSMPVFGRVADLETAGLGAQRTLTKTPEVVARYGRFDVATTWRNLTMTPDLPTLAYAATELYPQSGGQPINGLMVVDPTALAAIMRYTGDVQVEGLAQPLTADNVEQYLLFDQYLEFEDANADRVDVLETVARSTFERLTTVDLPNPRALSEHFDPVVDGGHLQFVSLALPALPALSDMGVMGQFTVPDEDTDSITVSTSNAAGNKIDLFLRRRERYDVQWDPSTGRVTGTFRLTLENTAPAEGLPDYVIGNVIGLPRGTNRSYVSIYSPFTLDGARLGGQPVALQPELELGRNVYSTFVDIPPGGTVELELDLSGTIEGRRYELDLPPQPFATPDEVDVSVEVAGVEPVARGEDVTVEGNRVDWSLVLDRGRKLSVTAPHG